MKAKIVSRPLPQTTIGAAASLSAEALTPSRRRALKIGAAAVAGLPFLLDDRPARAAPKTLSARKFDRGINAWPWFSFPNAIPLGGAAYSTWPPYNPDRPVPTRADLTALAAAGFDFIRVPIDPVPFLYLASAGQTQQYRRLMDDVIAAVRLASSVGLGVIVNVQPEAVAGYSPENLYGSTATVGSFHTYVNFIASLATELATLKLDRLALEPVNEPPQRTVVGSTVTSSAAKAAAADWASKQMTLLKTARTHAPTLKLVATGAFGGSIAGLVQLDPKTFDGLAPILFTFHFYDPYLFSHQGAPWLAQSEPTYGWLNAVPWPGAAGSLSQTMAAVRNRMSALPGNHTSAALKTYYNQLETALGPYFDPPIDHRYFTNDVGTGNVFFGALANWTAENGLGPERLIMGEFGALKTSASAMPVTGGPYVAAGAADRARYISDVRATAETQGYGWSMWTLFNPGMGIMDETTRTLDATVVAALGLTMPN